MFAPLLILQTFDAAEGKYQPETDALEDTNQDLRDEIANRRAAALNLKEALLEVCLCFRVAELLLLMCALSKKTLVALHLSRVYVCLNGFVSCLP